MVRSGKVEMRRIEDDARRQKTFGKRRGGVLKKAHALAVLCDAHVGVVIFSSTGKLSDYCSPHTSWSELIQRYKSSINVQLRETNHGGDQQMIAEILRLRHELDELEACLRRHTGEDLPSVATKEEFDNLQQQLEWALGKVYERKDELLNQQLDGQHRAVAEASAVATEGMVTPMLPSMAFGGFFPGVEQESSMSQQLRPQHHPPARSARLRTAGPQPAAVIERKTVSAPVAPLNM